MKRNTEEKSLMIIEEKNIFSRIIHFLKNLFHHKNDDIISIENTSDENSKESKNEFLNTIKIVVDEELEKLKDKIEAGKIIIEDLTEEQIDRLQILYDKQIDNDKVRLDELKRKLAYLTSNS